ncbi:RNA polymerase sigma-70 factor [Sphingobacterium thalpophilum]|uniref:RNA polymerase sigma-70 factor n=1 Tax=Sphingobacterium thalpophilum TaxID=259 RepID=UPI0037D9DC39
MDFTSTTIQYTGQQRKFREFYLTYKDKVYTYAFSHLKDKDMAVDVVQEAFTRIWKKVTAGEEPNNLQSYLYTVSRNIVFDEIRKEKVRMNFLEKQRMANEGGDNSGEEHIEFKDLERLYCEALELLPDARKRIYLLSKEEHLSNQEIADLLGISINTVRDQIVKSNKMVRQFILSRMGSSLALLIFLKIL